MASCLESRTLVLECHGRRHQAATRRSVSPGISTLGGSTLPGASPRVVRQLSNPRAQLGNVLGGRALGHRHTSQRLAHSHYGPPWPALSGNTLPGRRHASLHELGRLSHLNRRRAARYSSLALWQVMSRPVGLHSRLERRCYVQVAAAVAMDSLADLPLRPRNLCDPKPFGYKSCFCEINACLKDVRTDVSQLYAAWTASHHSVI